MRPEPTAHAEEADAVGEPQAVPAISGAREGAASTLLHGAAFGKAGVGLGADLVRIALGRSEIDFNRSDWRLKDPTWTGIPPIPGARDSFLGEPVRSVGLVTDAGIGVAAQVPADRRRRPAIRSSNDRYRGWRSRGAAAMPTGG
jgi:hypothetical protein